MNVSSSQRTFLNLGCGNQFHSDWINIDFNSPHQSVHCHDISQGIPYPDNHFDAVYHSHVLEHFTKKDGFFLLSECYRTLKLGAALRLVIPDLENILQAYLHLIENYQNTPDREDKHDWLIIELFDQCARESSGGEMKTYLSRRFSDDTKLFLIERVGDMFFSYQKDSQPTMSRPKTFHISKILRLLTSPAEMRERAVKLMLGRSGYKALQIGRFRLSGETHKWMYDKYSIQTILARIGFTEIEEKGHTMSRIKEWDKYLLDSDANGNMRMPASLIIEAVKE
jgi:predicted SAM-dependent methyltransferase